MADRRRRSSPDQSVSSRKHEPRRRDSRRSTHYEEIVPEPMTAPPQQQTQQPRSYEPADMRSSSYKATEQQRDEQYRGPAYASSYSSSSSSSYIDISRTFPPNRSGIRTFFTAPSEHRRKLRRRRSSRLFKVGNSSSSSVNSDLAYGTGYIKRPKSRVRSRKGKEIDRERYTERYGEQRYDSRYSDRERERTNATTTTIRNEGRDSRSGLSKAATDAEILALGAGLAKLAKESNKLDLKNSRNGKKPELGAPRETGHGLASSRGLGPSKISHGSDTFDEDGWESASDNESDASVDSRLAYDNNTKSRWSFFGRKKKFKPLSRKNTIVDPRLFGPANSLNGVVTQPVGFGEVSSWTSVSDFGQHVGSATPRPADSLSNSQQSLQQVYPVPTSDPDIFAAGRASRSSVMSTEPPAYASSRPGPIPLQQPQPITPVSQSVYEPIYPTRSESGGILKKPTGSSRTPSLAQAALVGVAGAAVGAAIASNRDDRKDRQREDELRDRERQKRRESERAETIRESERREAERRESERRDLERRDAERRELERREAERRDFERRELERKESERRRDKRSSPDRDDRKDKRRDKDRKDDTDRDKKREKRRDETRDDRDERCEKRRDERRSERGDRVEERVDVRPVEERRSEHPELVDRRTKSEAAVSTTSVDPFQYQVRESAFPTPTTEIPAGQRTPTVVTVEREPDFSRMQSYSIKDPSSGSNARVEVEYSDEDERDRRSRGRQSRDAPLHEAEDIYEETKHFTAPIAVAAIGAAVAADHHRESRSDKRRDERRSGSRGDYDTYDYKPSDKEQDRDREAERIQEEADRAYREIVMARKIASQVIRSRSPSPDPSVVEKYNTKEEEEIVRIVTPPGMEEHKKKGPYDAPNADFQLDHVIEPKEMHIFKAPSVRYGRAAPEPVFVKRDPDAERPRPLLNLVYPTPTPSPIPEKQKEREPTSSPKSKDREQPKVNTSDVVIGSRGNVVASPTTSTVSKAVTWGENETKHYEVESPSEHRDEFVSAADLPSREVPQEIKSSGSKSKGWGAIAAGIMGAGIGAAAASSSDSPKSSKSKKDDDKKSESSYEYRGVVVEPESPPRRKSPPRRERDQSPPSPGPKPASPRSSHVPGAFDDDLDFTATVAAGLQDTGFDPNIVINDPSFRRRDSPPGSNGPNLYHAPFAETVSDLGTIPPSAVGSVGSGFILGEVASTPRDWQSVSPAAEEFETPTKLSKKEQKKRDKQRRQSGDITPLEESSSAREVVEEPINDYFVEPKLSKKEQKKRDKEAARQAALAEEQTTPSVAEEKIEPPEAFFEAPKKSKKSKRSSSSPDEVAESSRTVSVPVDAFDDLKDDDDDWTDTRKRKKSTRQSAPDVQSSRDVRSITSVRDDSPKRPKRRDYDQYVSPPRSFPAPGAASEIGGIPRSKRDSERYESPPRSRDAISDVGQSSSTKDKSRRDSGRYDSPPRSRDAVSDIGRSSSSKDKSKRRSEQYERDPEEISLPPSTPSEVSRDGDYDDRKSRKSSNRDSGIFSSTDRDLSQSVVSADASRYDDTEPRRKKKSRSGRDDYDDTRSVASAPAGDDYDDSRKSSKKKDKEKDKKSSSIFSSLFGSKSESGARDDSPKGAKDDEDRKKSKKSKRHSVPDSSSIYSGLGAESVGDVSRSVSNGSNGKHHLDDDLDDGVRSDGEKRRKSRSRSGSTTSTKKDSFLDNAGILGAGVGIAGAAAVAIAAHQHPQSNAANTNNETAEQIRSMSAERPMAREEILDPEIAERQFRPSIDPQYGDLLPLPPSDPTSPNVEPVEELPELPESRPDTPDAERMSREKGINAIRRNLQETPIKSPSQSAVPLIFKMGNRSTPSSPGLIRSSPGHSPATPNAESLGFPKTRPSRPTSWDKSTEYKPLWLPETVARRGSTSQLQDSDDSYPELPPSETTSRSSSLLDFHDAIENPEAEQRSRSESLTLDTKFASTTAGELLDSTQTTPKAPNFSHEISGLESPIEVFKDASSFHDDARAPERPSTPVREKDSHSIGKDVAAVAAAAGLVSTLGYFASTPSRSLVKSDWMEDLPSAKREVSPTREAQPSERQILEDELPTISDQSSQIDPMTKDRSSYLLRSSPMPRKNDDETEALHSIQEHESNDASEPIAESTYDVEKERQRALEKLSSPREEVEDPFKTEEPTDEFVFKSKKDKKKDKKKGKGLSRSSTQDDLPLAESSRAVVPEPEIDAPSNTPVEQEPFEEFVTTKSKKDKKKGKGLSRSSTQDDLTTFEASEDVIPKSETPVLEVEPTEEFFTTKSKKDKKKDKKKNKSTSPWEPEETGSGTTTPAPETSENVLEEIPTSRDIQEPDIQKPTNDKGITSESTPAPELSRDIADDFSTPRSKKEKKKDKKKGKSTSAWESEQTESGITTPAVEQSEDVLEEPPIPRDSQEPEIQKPVHEPESTLALTEPGPSEETTFTTADEFSVPKSKKDKKKDRKNKSFSAWEPESFEEVPEEPLPETSTLATRELFVARDIEEEPIRSIAEEPYIEPPSVQDKSQEPSDDFSTPKSKKHKKKDKKKKSALIWEPEASDSGLAETLPEPSTPALEEATPITRDFQEAYFDQPVVEPQPSAEESSSKPSDDVPPPASNKDKKKRKSLLSWAWGADSSEPTQEPVQEPIEESNHNASESIAATQEQSKDLQQPQEPMPEISAPKNIMEREDTSSQDTPILHDVIPTTHEPEPIHEPSPAPIDLPSTRDIEDTSELLLPTTEPEMISEDSLPVTEEPESWSAPQSKKDKKMSKKNKSVLTWPEDEEESKLAEESTPETSKAVPDAEHDFVGKDEMSNPIPETVSVPQSTSHNENISHTPEHVLNTNIVDEEPIPTPIERSFEEPTQATQKSDIIPAIQLPSEHGEQPPLESSTPRDIEQADDFAPKSKKDRKKDKKKGKSTLAWEAEENQSGSQTPSASLEASRDVSEQASAVEDGDQFDSFSTSKSKKDKKKDKKKGKTIVLWDEPEPEPKQPAASGNLESTREMTEEPTISTPVVEAEDEFASFTSKKDEKKNKKNKSSSSWDPKPESQLQEPIASDTPIDETREISKEIAAPAPEADDDFPAFVSNKDKRKGNKGKSSSSWDPEPEPQVQRPIPSEAFVEENREIVEESNPVVPEPEPEDDFSAIVSKKDKKRDKKKGKASSSWEAESEPQLDKPIVSETSSQTDQEVQEPTAPTGEPEEEHISGKDQEAKALTTAELDEPRTLEPVEQQALASAREVPETSSIPIDNSIDSFSASKSKKDKKKDKKKSKSFLAWDADTTEQEPESSQTILPESGRSFTEEPSSISFGAIVPQDDISSKDPEEVVLSKSDTKEPQTSNHPVQESLPDAFDASLPKYSDIKEQQDPTIVQQPHHDFSGTNQGFSDTRSFQETPANVPENLEIRDRSLPVDQDANARDIPIETETETPLHRQDITIPEASSREIQHDVQNVESEPAIPDEFAMRETKKSKKKKNKSIPWDPDESAPVEETSLDTQADAREIAQEESVQDEFVLKSSKKDKKKKKGKSTSAWEPEPEHPVVEEPETTIAAPETVPDQIRDAPVDDESAFTESKRGKKKKGKSMSTWEPQPESTSTPIEAMSVQPIESFEEFTTPSSKKGKKKSKKSQAWGMDDELPTDDVAQEQSKAVEQDAGLPVPEIPSAKPTPMGGPGAWPITPATPMTGGEAASGQVPSDKHKDYFPSTSAMLPAAAVGAALLGAEAIHDRSVSEKDVSAEPSSSKSMDREEAQIPGSETKPAPNGLTARYDNDQLSLARQLQEEFGSGSKKSKKDKSKRKSLPATPARQISRSRAVDDLSEDHHRARSLSIEPSPARSGVSAGTGERPVLYSEEQLELARQLKEEFGSGSKKSKKDKKKKRNFSEEPTQEDDFTREFIQEPQSMTPGATEDTAQLETMDAPRGDGFAAGYQEDQLSLARQLQAEFGKKSKKDKKRRSTSQTPLEQDTPADDYFGERSQPQYSEPLQYEPPPDAPEPVVQEKEPTRDGLAVGYSEDQLELARQLKEEFGSGSKKKGKKDKKRQSLLRGNTEDDFSSDAFMGESEQQSGLATPLDEGTREPSFEPEDAFATVSKKSKKDKKGKKRESSLLRDAVDDNFTAEPTPEITSESKNIEPSNFDPIVRGLDEPAIVEPEDEFAPVKKSKKDRKGKKRESLVPGEDFQPEISFQDIPAQDDAPQPQIAAKDIEQSAPIEPEDDFAPVKKSKKDKKGKKRGSLKPDTTEEAVVPDTLSESVDKEQEPMLSVTDERVTNLETQGQEPSTLPAEDDFGFPTTKKSKKDKKNRKSTARIDESFNQPEPEISTASQFPEVDEPSTADITSANSGPDVVAESAEFELGRKLSKKEKKRQSLLRSSTFDEPSEPLTESRDVQPEMESRDLAETTVAAPLEEPQDDGFEFLSKKSKKDKEKQKISRQASLAADLPVEEIASSSTQPEVINDQILDRSIEHSSMTEPSTQMTTLESMEARDVEMSHLPAEAEETPKDMFGDYTFTKQSKKDKKKRKDASKQDSDEASRFSTPMDPGTDLKTIDESSLPSEEISKKSVPEQDPALEGVPSTTDREVIDEPVDDWASFPTKKSKKNKKRKGSSKPGSEGPSGTTTPFETIPESIETVKSELPSQDFQESVQAENYEDLPSSSMDAQQPDDEWDSVPSKKSKKDKKKRKSGLSTPIEETMLESEQRLEEITAPSVSREINQEEVLSKEEPFPQDLERPEPVTHEHHAVNIPAEIIPHHAEPSEVPFNQESSVPIETRDVVSEPEAEWAAIPKKSKKDKKKRKSGISTPVEESMPSGFSEELAEHSHFIAPEVTAGTKETNFDRDAAIHPEPSTAEAEGEWGSLSRKSSKKDKKKKKSGLSTPVEELMPAVVKEEAIGGPSQHIAAQENTPEINTSTSERVIHGQDATVLPESTFVEPEGEWGMLSRKASKKDKKKRKSGLSTPIEEPMIAEPSMPTTADLEKDLPEITSRGPEFADAPSGESTSQSHAFVDDTLPISQEREPSSTVQNTQNQEPTDEFAFITKRSKKDKGKKASCGESEIEPGSFVPSGTSGPINLFPQNDSREIALEVPERQTSSPVSFEKGDTTREPSPPEPSPDSNDFDTHHAEAADVFPSDLSRKPSKKDKRKRQATVIVGVDDGQSTAKAPLTSWADEVEEAEVIRDHPIIEDLAKDETLSHIPSTTESAPVDDFVRPSKKGKKGKKRSSSQVNPADIPHPPIGADIPKDESSDKSSNVATLAALAAGAGLAGATLFAHVKDSPEETNTSESSTPVRKLSKKEKRKQSIDKRTPKDDMFDDPALWEGEKPRAYEGRDDEDDGFWTPPREEEQSRDTKDVGFEEVRPVDESSARESKVDVASHATPQQLFPSFAPDAFSKLDEMDPMDEDTEREPEIHPTISTTRESIDTESQPKDSFYEFVPPRPGESTSGITSSLESNAFQDAPHQNTTAESFGQSYRHEPPRSIVTTPPEETDISFERAPPISQEHISTPHRDYVESHDTDRSFHDSPIEYRQSTPLSSRKYARLSDLPVVHEETQESEQHPSGQYHDVTTSHRDSAYESPIPPQKGFSDLHEHVRDSGVHLRDFSPADKVRAPVSSTDDALARLSWPPVDEESETVDLHKSQRLKVTSKKHYEDGKRSVEVHDSPRPRGDKATDFYRSQRISEEKPILHHDDGHLSRDTLPSQQVKDEAHAELHRTPTIHGHGTRRSSQGSLVQQRLQKFESPDTVRSTPPRAGNIVKQRVQGFETPDSQRVQKLGPETPDLPPPHKPAFETPGSQRSDRSQSSDHDSPEYQRSQRPKEDKYAGLTSTERPKAEKPQGFNNLETGAALAGAAALGFAAARKLSQEQRPGSAQSIRSTSGGVSRLRTPDLHRPDSVNSNRSGTPPLRRSDRKVADLRSLSQRSKPDLAKEAELAANTDSTVSTANPTANEGRVRAKDMADVYDGFGEGRMGSPRSPTRPHSMRRRQSMQVLELENRVEQLAADNRRLAEFKAEAERNFNATQSATLVDKDTEIDALKRTLDWLQHEVTRLTEVNEGLSSANAEIARQHSDRYGMLETQHAQATRELQETRDAHTNLSSGVEGMVRSEVQKVVLDKDQEIAELRAELNAAKEKIREMQRQILASKANDIEFLTVRDEDYFDNACQQLCQHVQQWVLRFSKFSDMRACRLTREINNDKIIDRLDNAILDGSDVDIYLADRVKRRDIFMSMTMTMVWEFVFTRYLFGMDREQRQKLKSLEKTLSEVGPAAAVHSWRATTLTLLSKREAFQQQREQDTKAVVHAILETLSEILPPPSNLESQIEEQLTRVMKAAVDLSIEMRCQRAEYMMLPPLQPEYDANGDLASKVSFNAALMNERSGDTVSNEDLETQKAVVRIVLFPLVVKKGDDSGEGDEEIVVCPAQVLVAKSKKARFTDTAQSNHSRMSMQSSMPVDAGDENVI
ncbi:uncharacterized protein LY89DRAFT_664359 [Mollisia scopiformis]|uniref:Involucrin repeat protein n=1 Tax=Mollisia scopiformis TaxID=149040 RepID=A0A194XR69_MOLSC|nr:uncharacterized protein LY89DRAFT_664359 [Mollisia scopiformis]KUJ22549.1 hypothetical protein LY89DRAFT_664359 [Mollisia scopiformis]